MKSLSRVRLLATPWTAAHEAPPSMGFSRREYWSGVPLPSPKACLSRYIFNSTLYKLDITYKFASKFFNLKKNAYLWPDKYLVEYTLFKNLSISDFLRPHGLQSCQDPPSMGILQARILEWVPCPPPGDLPNPGIESRFPLIVGRSFTI